MSPRPLKRAVATLLVAVISGHAVLADAAEAMWNERRRAVIKVAALPALPSPSAIAPQLGDAVDARFPRLALGAKDRSTAALIAALPASHGRVTATAPERPSATVVLIEDIHRNDEAQRNIASAVSSLNEKGLVNIIGLEGAASPIDVEPFRKFPYPKATAVAADYFLSQGLISGPIHAALLSTRPLPPIVGLETERLYDENVAAVQKADPLRATVQADLARAADQVATAKARTFSPGLMALDGVVSGYRRGATPLGTYLHALAGDRETLPASIANFLKALALEQTLSFANVESERRRLLEALASRLPKAALEDLAAASLAYRMGQIGHANFYTALEKLCADHGLPLGERFPAMRDYVRYVLLIDAVDAARLLRDATDLEERVFAEKARTPDERRLLDESKALDLSQKLVAFSLTTAEWETYKGLDVRRPELAPFESFYRLAEARDKAMVDNFLNAMKRHDGKTGVFVAGGFHSAGIRDQLLARGIACVRFTPRVTRVDASDGSKYLSVFTREKTDIERLFQGEKLFLAQSPVASQLAAELPQVQVAVHFTHDPASESQMKQWYHEARHAAGSIGDIRTDGLVTTIETHETIAGNAVDFQTQVRRKPGGGIADVRMEPARDPSTLALAVVRAFVAKAIAFVRDVVVQFRRFMQGFERPKPEKDTSARPQRPAESPSARELAGEGWLEQLTRGLTAGMDRNAQATAASMREPTETPKPFTWVDAVSEFIAAPALEGGSFLHFLPWFPRMHEARSWHQWVGMAMIYGFGFGMAALFGAGVQALWNALLVVTIAALSAQAAYNLAAERVGWTNERPSWRETVLLAGAVVAAFTVTHALGGFTMDGNALLRISLGGMAGHALYNALARVFGWRSLTMPTLGRLATLEQLRASVDNVPEAHIIVRGRTAVIRHADGRTAFYRETRDGWSLRRAEPVIEEFQINDEGRLAVGNVGGRSAPPAVFVIDDDDVRQVMIPIPQPAQDDDLGLPRAELATGGRAFTIHNGDAAAAYRIERDGALRPLLQGSRIVLSDNGRRAAVQQSPDGVVAVYDLRGDSPRRIGRGALSADEFYLSDDGTVLVVMRPDVIRFYDVASDRMRLLRRQIDRGDVTFNQPVESGALLITRRQRRWDIIRAVDGDVRRLATGVDVPPTGNRMFSYDARFATLRTALGFSLMRNDGRNLISYFSFARQVPAELLYSGFTLSQDGRTVAWIDGNYQGRVARMEGGGVRELEPPIVGPAPIRFVSLSDDGGEVTFGHSAGSTGADAAVLSFADRHGLERTARRQTVRYGLATGVPLPLNDPNGYRHLSDIAWRLAVLLSKVARDTPLAQSGAPNLAGLDKFDRQLIGDGVHFGYGSDAFDPVYDSAMDVLLSGGQRLTNEVTALVASLDQENPPEEGAAMTLGPVRALVEFAGTILRSFNKPTPSQTPKPFTWVDAVSEFVAAPALEGGTFLHFLPWFPRMHETRSWHQWVIGMPMIYGMGFSAAIWLGSGVGAIWSSLLIVTALALAGQALYNVAAQKFRWKNKQPSWREILFLAGAVVIAFSVTYVFGGFSLDWNTMLRIGLGGITGHASYNVMARLLGWTPLTMPYLGRLRALEPLAAQIVNEPTAHLVVRGRTAVLFRANNRADFYRETSDGWLHRLTEANLTAFQINDEGLVATGQAQGESGPVLFVVQDNDIVRTTPNVPAAIAGNPGNAGLLAFPTWMRPSLQTLAGNLTAPRLATGSRVFTVQNGRPYVIYEVERNGNLRTLLSGQANRGLLSDNGRRAAIQENEDQGVVIYDLSSNPPRPLGRPTPPATDFAFSDDGTTLVLQNNAGIRIYQVTETGPRVLRARFTGSDDLRFFNHPVATGAVVTIRDRGQAQIVRVVGSSVRRLADGAFRDVAFGYDARIAAVSTVGATGLFHNNGRRLVPHGNAVFQTPTELVRAPVRLSPNGRTLAFVNSQHHGQVVRVTADGVRPLGTIVAPAPIRTVSLSPDGGLVTFGHSAGPTGNAVDALPFSQRIGLESNVTHQTFDHSTGAVLPLDSAAGYGHAGDAALGSAVFFAKVARDTPLAQGGEENVAGFDKFDRQIYGDGVHSGYGSDELDISFDSAIGILHGVERLTNEVTALVTSLDLENPPEEAAPMTLAPIRALVGFIATFLGETIARLRGAPRHSAADGSSARELAGQGWLEELTRGLIERSDRNAQALGASVAPKPDAAPKPFTLTDAIAEFIAAPALEGGSFLHFLPWFPRMHGARSWHQWIGMAMIYGFGFGAAALFGASVHTLWNALLIVMIAALPAQVAYNVAAERFGWPNEQPSWDAILILGSIVALALHATSTLGGFSPDGITLLRVVLGGIAGHALYNVMARLFGWKSLSILSYGVIRDMLARRVLRGGERWDDITVTHRNHTIARHGGTNQRLALYVHEGDRWLDPVNIPNVRLFRISDDGRTVVTLTDGGDLVARMWTGRRFREIPLAIATAPQLANAQVALSEEGSVLLVSCAMMTWVIHLDDNDEGEDDVMPGNLGLHRSISRNGQVAVMTTDRGVRPWRLDGQAREIGNEIWPADDFALAADGSALAVRQGNNVRLFSITNDVVAPIDADLPSINQMRPVDAERGLILALVTTDWRGETVVVQNGTVQRLSAPGQLGNAEFFRTSDDGRIAVSVYQHALRVFARQGAAYWPIGSLLLVLRQEGQAAFDLSQDGRSVAFVERAPVAPTTANPDGWEWRRVVYRIESGTEGSESPGLRRIIDREQPTVSSPSFPTVTFRGGGIVVFSDDSDNPNPLVLGLADPAHATTRAPWQGVLWDFLRVAAEMRRNFFKEHAELPQDPDLLRIIGTPVPHPEELRDFAVGASAIAGNVEADHLTDQRARETAGGAAPVSSLIAETLFSWADGIAARSTAAGRVARFVVGAVLLPFVPFQEIGHILGAKATGVGVTWTFSGLLRSVHIDETAKADGQAIFALTAGPLAHVAIGLLALLVAGWPVVPAGGIDGWFILSVFGAAHLLFVVVEVTISLLSRHGDAWDVFVSATRRANETDKPAPLVIDDAEARAAWDQDVAEALRVVDFSRRLSRLTRRHGSLFLFPQKDLDALLAGNLFGSGALDHEGLYRLGMASANMSLPREFAEMGAYNFVLIFALMRSGIGASQLGSAEENDGAAKRLLAKERLFMANLLNPTASNAAARRYNAQSFDFGLALLQINASADQRNALREECLSFFHQVAVTVPPSHRDMAAVRHAQARPQVALLPEFRQRLPAAFFEAPQAFIEAQETVANETLFKSIERVGRIGRGFQLSVPLTTGADIGKVKRWTLPDGLVVYAKCVDPLRVRAPNEEIDVARRIDQALQAADRRFHAQRFIGIAYDRGSFYLLSEGVPGQPVSESDAASENDVASVEALLRAMQVTDPSGQVRKKDILRTTDGQYVVIDFETLPYRFSDEEDDATATLPSTYQAAYDSGRVQNPPEKMTPAEKAWVETRFAPDWEFLAAYRSGFWKDHGYGWLRLLGIGLIWLATASFPLLGLLAPGDTLKAALIVYGYASALFTVFMANVEPKDLQVPWYLKVVLFPAYVPQWVAHTLWNRFVPKAALTMPALGRLDALMTLAAEVSAQQPLEFIVRGRTAAILYARRVEVYRETSQGWVRRLAENIKFFEINDEGTVVIGATNDESKPVAWVLGSDDNFQPVVVAPLVEGVVPVHFLPFFPLMHRDYHWTQWLGQAAIYGFALGAMWFFGTGINLDTNALIAAWIGGVVGHAFAGGVRRALTETPERRLARSFVAFATAYARQGGGAKLADLAQPVIDFRLAEERRNGGFVEFSALDFSAIDEKKLQAEISLLLKAKEQSSEISSETARTIARLFGMIGLGGAEATAPLPDGSLLFPNIQALTESLPRTSPDRNEILYVLGSPDDEGTVETLRHNGQVIRLLPRDGGFLAAGRLDFTAVNAVLIEKVGATDLSKLTMVLEDADLETLMAFLAERPSGSLLSRIRYLAIDRLFNLAVPLRGTDVLALGLMAAALAAKQA